MQARDWIILVCSVFLAVGFLWAAGRQIDPINEMREEMGLTINPALENAPPSLAFATVAMGAFRGLVVDILWMRADTLKDQGQFFDAKQLADWICALQPRFGAVWEFQAWNMAYNISVAIPATQPDQRWRWVRNGYELLRDKGIELNPKNLQLYRELARIFQHKIGGITDDAHKYYKIQLAWAMQPLVADLDAEAFEKIIAAPHTWEEIEADPNVGPILQALVAADGAFKNKDNFMGTYLAFITDPNEYALEARDVLEKYENTSALQELGYFITAHTLRNMWKMDPVIMHEANKEFGPIDYNDPNKVIPLDWRHPDSHAIYWAYKGLKLGSGQLTDEEELTTHEMNTDRIIIHSLQSLYRGGKYYFYRVQVPPPEDAGPDAQPQVMTDLLQRPDDRMFERYDRYYWGLLEKYEEDRGRKVSLTNGYRNYMKNSIFHMYQTGHKQLAANLYKKMQKRFWQIDTSLHDDLETFARKRFKEEFEGLGINDAREQIMALIREGYAHYAFGDDDKTAANEAFAQKIWEFYQYREFADENSQQRVGLAPMPELRYVSLLDFMNDPQYPSYLKDAMWNRMRIERPELYQKLDERRKQDLSEEQRNQEVLQQVNP